MMTMPDTEDFDRTGTPHVVVAVKTEIGGNCQQSKIIIVNLLHFLDKAVIMGL
jgi:hypothetical protein